MSIKIKHPGRLHRDLGVPQGEPIPESKIKAAESSSDPAVRKRAQFADNARHFDHGGKPASVTPRHHPSSAYRR